MRRSSRSGNIGANYACPLIFTLHYEYAKLELENFRMAHLFVDLNPSTHYWDKRSGLSRDEWFSRLQSSTTLYVGNLSFYTTEDQIYELFSRCAEVSKVVMGLNRFKKSPCGFCFVEFASHADASIALSILNTTSVDDRIVRIDWDAGVDEGRQFGRGQSGDQWRDDFREDFDPARGGQGRALLKTLDDPMGRQIFVGKKDFASRATEGTYHRGGKGKGKGQWDGGAEKRRRSEGEGDNNTGGGGGFYKRVRNN
jgi:nuclear cap-binding protein subunit 2